MRGDRLADDRLDEFFDEHAGLVGRDDLRV